MLMMIPINHLTLYFSGESNMETLAGAIIALAVAVIGNAGAVWYKLGQLEGKVDTLVRSRNCEEKTNG